MNDLRLKKRIIEVGGVQNIVFGLIYLTFFGYFLLVYPFAFNFELYIHGHYFGVVIAGIAILSYGLFSFLQNRPDKSGFYVTSSFRDMTGTLILLLITTGYLCFPSCRGNEYLVNASIAGICLILLRSMSLHALRVLLIIIAAGGLLELMLALVMTKRNFSGEPGAIIGSLHNTGVLAIFLVIQLPLLWYSTVYYSLKWMPRHGRWIRFALFCPAVFLVLAICVHSRARMAIVTIAVLLILVLWRYCKNALFRLRMYVRAVSVLLLLCIAILSGYYFFHMKEGSSIGRLLILDVSVRHLPDHFWLGTGLGRFSWYYPQWQAAYFFDHPLLEGPFFLSAGETYIVFNEFLQLLETVGLLGFLLVLLSFTWFFTAISVRSKELLITCKVTVIAILSCCCFHYPLHLNAILLILALCFSIVAAIRENDFFFNILRPAVRKKWLCLSGAVAMILAVPALLTGFNQYVDMEKWQLIKDDDRAERDVLKKEAISCYDHLRYDGKFLAEYSAFLARDSSELPKAIAMAEASSRSFISWLSMENLAYYYLQQKDYVKAINTFEWLSEYVPNQFRPRLELLELYKRTQHPDSARRTAAFILAMPVKVPSDEVSEIKEEAESTIKLSQ